MSKKRVIGASIIILIIGTAVFGFYKFLQLNHPYMGINTEKLPKVITDQILEKHNSDLERIYGFCGKDLSQKDMSQVSRNKMSDIAFDESTKWPLKDTLSKGFQPNLWMSIGKDPGLNLNKIHNAGITGKGITVAVIDKPILPTHNEFKGRITYVRVGENQTQPHFHGLGVASILAGKTTGVAPDAKLYYFSCPDGSNRFKNYMDAINKAIDVNKTLPKDKKIRLISISDGFSKTSGSEWDNWQLTLKKAKSEGIEIVYSNYLENFVWGGCRCFEDRNNPLNYKLTNYLKGKEIAKSEIIVPADFRTTASNNGNDKYTYWGEGGFSWAIPYVSGLATLAWQINPNLSLDDIIDKLVATKTVTSEGRSIINPEAFIRSIN